jgi:hypothetical protein
VVPAFRTLTHADHRSSKLVSDGGLVETRDRKGRFFELGQQLVAEALAEPDLDAAVRQLVRLLLKHAGGRLADDVLLVLSEPVGARDVLSSPL